MRHSLNDELRYGTLRAIRVIIPELHNRIPITWQTWPYPIACYLPFVFLAYLTRRPDTYLIRLLLFPIVLCGIVASAYRYVWTIPQLNVYNWGQCLLAAVTIAKALEFALRKEGMLKVGESRPGHMKGKANANGPQKLSPKAKPAFIPAWLYDALEVMHTLRGLKWKFGQGVHVPKHTKPLERDAFLRETAKSFLKNYLLLDLLESGLKLFPGVGSPLGGSMFYSDLQPFTRYFVSTLIHMMTGSAILVGFKMVHDLSALVAITIFNSSPTSWPPVMDHPWSADSMHAFWAKHWHQLLRQTFLVLGGYPGQWIAGDVGMLLGTFIASGLFHECAMYSMGRGLDHTVSMFFALQGFILILERIWRKVTGRRIGGWPGRLWVYSIMFIGAQPVVNAWHRRGLGGGMVIPPFLSPVRLFLLPAIRQFLHTGRH